jgi:hypothetical protein
MNELFREGISSSKSGESFCGASVSEEREKKALSPLTFFHDFVSPSFQRDDLLPQKKKKTSCFMFVCLFVCLFVCMCVRGASWTQLIFTNCRAAKKKKSDYLS